MAIRMAAIIAPNNQIIQPTKHYTYPRTVAKNNVQTMHKKQKSFFLHTNKIIQKHQK